MTHLQKPSKKSLALLLVVIMALGISVPVKAQELDNPLQSVILAQPYPQNQMLDARESVILHIDAQAPEGWELSYQWFSHNLDNAGPIEGATGATLSIPFGHPSYPRRFQNSSNGFYSCDLTLVQRDGSGAIVDTAVIYSNLAMVSRELTLWEKIGFGFEMAGSLVFGIFAMPFVLVFFLWYAFG